MAQLTVAICTFRRYGLLQTTLASLAACKRPDIDWQLLVVDNACDPQIETLVRSFSHRLPLHYLSEPRLGASWARNRATREAAAPLILFTDDDVTFDPDWLVRMWQAVTDHPECAFWGGRVEPVWGHPPPAWFNPELCPTLADAIVQYDRGRVSRPWDPRRDPPFYTANLALRTDAIADAGYFDTTVGHRGDHRMGMEDSLMVKAIAGTGGPGWYVADAVVHHPVPCERLTRGYLRRFALRQAWLSTRIHRGHRAIPPWFYRAAAGRMVEGLRLWSRGLARRDPGAAFAGEFSTLSATARIACALMRL